MSIPTELPTAPVSFVPIPVQREADEMARRTGAQPEITYDGAIIGLTHESGTARIEVVFRYGSRGWTRADYRLFYNNVPVDETPSWELYRALAKRQSAPGTASLPVLAPYGDHDTLPTGIRQQLAVLQQRLDGRTDITVHVGRDDEGHYVIALVSPKVTMHMVFECRRRHGRPYAVPAGIDPIRVVTADGKDLTREIQGKLRHALAQLLAARPGTSLADGGDGQTQGAQSGGPTSRKGTVLRL
ncbi:hypothetical protein [Streptomyces viridochromogenes]|uniref:hypothetical protein n=1 Tax=Streptomyces viridochromogenes TaxID=1938 RepID=UPI0031D9B57E